jgi:hypothetical protein
MFFAFSTSAFCQEELFYRQVRPLEELGESGPGSDVHSFAVFSFGLKPDIIGTRVSRIKASSNSFTVGRRVKYRLNDHFSFVNGQHFRRVSIRPKPSYFMYHLVKGIELENQQIAQHFIGLDLSLRFNYQPVGNAYGNYVEFGVWGDFLLWSKYAWTPKGTDEKLGRYPINFMSDHNRDINVFAAGAHLRLGFGWFSIFTEYRSTPFFKAFSSDELGEGTYNAAPLTVGIEFVLLSLD